MADLTIVALALIAGGTIKSVAKSVFGKDKDDKKKKGDD